MHYFFPIVTLFLSLTSFAVETPSKPGAAKLADFFRGSWAGEEFSEVDKKKSGGKAWMKCESIGKDFGSQCLLTSSNSPSSPEYWFIGRNQKNESNHIFIITPKSAHDHAAKWISEDEISVTPIANNPDNCGVIRMSIKKAGIDTMVFGGTEINKEGKLVSFSANLKRTPATR